MAAGLEIPYSIILGLFNFFRSDWNKRIFEDRKFQHETKKTLEIPHKENGRPRSLSALQGFKVYIMLSYDTVCGET